MSFASPVRRLARALLLTLVFAAPAAARAADALYLALQAATTLPTSPSSLLLQSPSFISVPAGAVLSVHLLRGEQIVSTSRVVFSAAYSNLALIPSVPLAMFEPTGSAVTPGEPLAGAVLTGGTADLAAIAANPGQYRLLWLLSDGSMGVPGRAVMTGAPVGFVDMRVAEVSAAVRQSDQKPGSVLFFPRYYSDLNNSARENTTLSVTNTSPAETAYVRMFFVSGADCSVVEVAFCLAAQQRLSLRMSDYDPGTKGYCVAVASNQSGQPIQFNWLIGQAQMRLAGATSGALYDVTLPALAVAKRVGGAIVAVGNAAEMAFDDLMYDRLPSQLAADNVPSQASSQNATVVTLARPVASLAGGSVNPTAAFTAYNSGGAASSASRPLACQYEAALSSLRFSPTQLNTLLPSGESGWLKASSPDSLPLIGAQFNTGQFSGGAPLRALAFAADYRISVPLRAVACQ
jgi:hypothetical protein